MCPCRGRKERLLVAQTRPRNKALAGHPAFCRKPPRSLCMTQGPSWSTALLAPLSPCPFPVSSYRKQLRVLSHVWGVLLAVCWVLCEGFEVTVPRATCALCSYPGGPLGRATLCPLPCPCLPRHMCTAHPALGLNFGIWKLYANVYKGSCQRMTLEFYKF